MCVHAFSSHFSLVKGFPQESSGGIVLFFFLIVLQGSEHSSRKTRHANTNFLYMGVVYTLSLDWDLDLCQPGPIRGGALF